MRRDEGRPGEKAAPTQTNTSRVQPIGDTEVGRRRRTWAYDLIDRQTPDRPIYGSEAWLCLPSDHPDKIGAVVVAAECWASMADTLEDDLRREVELERAAFKRAEDQAYAQSLREHRDRLRGRFGFVPTTFQERRARQVEAARPRPGDYPGRGGGDAA